MFDAFLLESFAPFHCEQQKHTPNQCDVENYGWGEQVASFETNEQIITQVQQDTNYQKHSMNKPFQNTSVIF